MNILYFAEFMKFVAKLFRPWFMVCRAAGARKAGGRSAPLFLEKLVHRPLRLCTLTSLKLTSALRWILNTKIMEKNLRLLYVIMILFMFVTTRTIFLHMSSVFSFRWNILQIICMQKLKCMYLTWNSSGVYLRPKNCNYSHRKILYELFGSWRKEIITDYYFARSHTLFFSDLAS